MLGLRLLRAIFSGEIWYAHAAMRDTLALHLRNVGYDPLTGQVSMPQALPTETLHGCGGSSYLPAETTGKEGVAAV